MTEFSLPAFPRMTGETLRAVSDRHGLGGRPFVRLPGAGVFNAIRLLGDDMILLDSPGERWSRWVP